MSRAAMEMALDALKQIDKKLLFDGWENRAGDPIGKQLRNTVEALRAELAKPEPLTLDQRWRSQSQDNPYGQPLPPPPELKT